MNETKQGPVHFISHVHDRDTIFHANEAARFKAALTEAEALNP